MKKTILSIGTLATLVTPVALVVSCGTKKTTAPKLTLDGSQGTETGEGQGNVAEKMSENYAEGDMMPATKADLDKQADFSLIAKDSEHSAQDFATYRLGRADRVKASFETVMSAETTTAEQVAEAIIRRYIGDKVDNIVFTKIDKKFIAKDPQNDQDADHTFNKYSYEVKADGKLYIEGSSAVAMSHAWYEWLKKNGYGMIGWQSNSIRVPETLIQQEKVEVTSPYERHYFGNSATAGYSTPWWDKHNWMDWLSWSAVHGYDMMLDYVGAEEISRQLLSEMGFSPEEIKNYFTGPAYATWARLGNMSGWDTNPYFEKWCAKQKDLQKDILVMMKKMDITPIVSSWAGFLPQNTPQKYAGVNVTQTHWTSEEDHHNWFLDPNAKISSGKIVEAMNAAATGQNPTSKGYVANESLFRNLSRRYVELYQAEFGEQDFYLADSFEEMTIPDGVRKNDFYKFVGTELYKGIETATAKNQNGSASWAFQGWMLGFQRGDWDFNALHSFLDIVPKNKVLVIDEAEDYNDQVWNNHANFDYFKDPSHPDTSQSFDGARWVYSTIPNMGGNTEVTGDLKWYGNAGPDALAASNHGYLYAYGSAPEGIDNNPVTQELISDMGWRTTPIDITAEGSMPEIKGGDWLANYDYNRYGFENRTIRQYWLERLATANAYLDDHPISYFQFHGWGTWTAPDTDAYLKAMLKFKDAAKERAGLFNTPLFRDDLFRTTAQYLSIMLDRKIKAFQTLPASEKPAAKVEIDKLYTKMDKILETHNTDRLSRWLKMARRWGDTPEEKTYYERDAKYHLTLWYPSLNDYAAKTWNGLIGGYYKDRLDHEMDQNMNPTNPGFNAMNFIENPLSEEVLHPEAYAKPLESAVNLMEEYNLVPRVGLEPDAVASVNSMGYRKDLSGVVTKIQLTTEQLKNLSSMTILADIEATYKSDWKVGNPSIATITIKAGTGIIWQNNHVTGANIVKGTALTVPLEGLSTEAALNSNNGAEMIITWKASIYTKASMEFFFNQEGKIDGSKEETKIDHADTYRTLDHMIRNEYDPSAAALTPITIPLNDLRNKYTYLDGTVNTELAAANHITITETRHEPLTTNPGYRVYHYQITPAEGYRLLDTEEEFFAHKWIAYVNAHYKDHVPALPATGSLTGSSTTGMTSTSTSQSQETGTPLNLDALTLRSFIRSNGSVIEEKARAAHISMKLIQVGDKLSNGSYQCGYDITPLPGYAYGKTPKSYVSYISPFPGEAIAQIAAQPLATTGTVINVDIETLRNVLINLDGTVNAQEASNRHLIITETGRAEPDAHGYTRIQFDVKAEAGYTLGNTPVHFFADKDLAYAAKIAAAAAPAPAKEGVPTPQPMAVPTPGVKYPVPTQKPGYAVPSQMGSTTETAQTASTGTVTLTNDQLREMINLDGSVNEEKARAAHVVITESAEPTGLHTGFIHHSFTVTAAAGYSLGNTPNSFVADKLIVNPVNFEELKSKYLNADGSIKTEAATKDGLTITQVGNTMQTDTAYVRHLFRMVNNSTHVETLFYADYPATV